MLYALADLGLFASKAFIIFLAIAAILILFFLLLAKSKQKLKGQLKIKNLNKKYEEDSEELLAEILPKKLFKNFLKKNKDKHKKHIKAEQRSKISFVVHFHGDIKASAVTALREEVTAILNIAEQDDEVIICLESAGGMVHAYGLAASQLMRIRDRNIPLTVCIDKMAASGGYMMACVGNKILAAPFSIVGSIGVVIQMPNFHRLLKEKQIDFEMETAGEYKRTLTMFGENTDEGRDKLKQEIDVIHDDFKKLISAHRPDVDINKVATGEHWLGQQALDLKLVDDIKTSDDYLLERAKDRTLYEINYEIKKPLGKRLSEGASVLVNKLIHPLSA